MCSVNRLYPLMPRFLFVDLNRIPMCLVVIHKDSGLPIEVEDNLLLSTTVPNKTAL